MEKKKKDNLYHMIAITIRKNIYRPSSSQMMDLPRTSPLMRSGLTLFPLKLASSVNKKYEDFIRK